MHTVYRKHTGALEYTREPLSLEQGETFSHACTVLRFVIAPGERITMGEWCQRIERHYTPSAKRDASIAAIRAAGGVRSFWLSVIFPMDYVPAAYRVEVLRVDAASSLQWMREHADEIATKHSGAGYCALMVRDHQPDDERAACA